MGGEEAQGDSDWLRLRQTEWETDRQHTLAWGRFVLSSMRFGHTCLHECFHLESLSQGEEKSALVPFSATRTKKRSKLSFTSAALAPKQIVFSKPFSAVLPELRLGCVLELEWWGRWANFVLPASRHSCVPLCALLHQQVGLHLAWLHVYLWSDLYVVQWWFLTLFKMIIVSQGENY